MGIVCGGRTHVGKRENNEDALLVDGQLGLFVVADGMGGYEGGEVASRLAVETIYDFVASARGDDLATGPIHYEPSKLHEENLLGAAVAAAHQSIVSRRQGSVIEMGSTVVAVLVADGHLVVAHVGDSRLYRLRDGELLAMTRDHSAREELKAMGYVDTRYTNRHQLTRALGVEHASQADVARHEMCLGDAYLLCSDGMYEPLEETDLKMALRLSPGEGCEYLISRALEYGGVDNLTGLILHVAKD